MSAMLINMAALLLQRRAGLCKKHSATLLRTLSLRNTKKHTSVNTGDASPLLFKCYSYTKQLHLGLQRLISVQTRPQPILLQVSCVVSLDLLCDYGITLCTCEAPLTENDLNRVMKSAKTLSSNYRTQSTDD